jgi:hypothetical protein
MNNMNNSCYYKVFIDRLTMRMNPRCYQGDRQVHFSYCGSDITMKYSVSVACDRSFKTTYGHCLYYPRTRTIYRTSNLCKKL